MTPKVFNSCSEMSAYCSQQRHAERSIGLVPTMGALHDGHMSLVKKAREENDIVIVSIFVNPTQFGPNEDFDKYPRTFEEDVEICDEAGVDAVFAPSPDEMYPQGFDTQISQTKLTSVMCGGSRPGHFSGVLTVCCKLFNIIGPDVAYFGQKDYQQVAVIKRMAADLNMPLQIEMCPIYREKDGLAMSSRNRYLSSSERADAICLSRALEEAEEMVADGETNAQEILEKMKNLIGKVKSATIDYVVIADANTLEPVGEIQDCAVAALAVKIGSTRLIDNAILRCREAGGKG